MVFLLGLISLVVGVVLGFWFSGQQIERQKQFYEDESRKLRDELERNYQSRMAATIDSLRKDHENQLSKKTEELQKAHNEISSLKATYQAQISQAELKDSSLDVKDVNSELINPMVEDTISSNDDSSIAEIVDNSDSESINITPQTDIQIISDNPTETSGESVITSETITELPEESVNITTETPVIELVNLTSETSETESINLTSETLETESINLTSETLETESINLTSETSETESVPPVIELVNLTSETSETESINLTSETLETESINLTSETSETESVTPVIKSVNLTSETSETESVPTVELVNLTSENTAENISDTRENQQQEIIQSTIIQSSEADTILEVPGEQTATDTKTPIVMDDEGWEIIPDEHPSEIPLLIISNRTDESDLPVIEETEEDITEDISDESDLPVIEETEEDITENSPEISDLSVIEKTKEDLTENISEKPAEKATFGESLSIGELTQYIYHPDSKIRILLAINLGKIATENKRLIPQIITTLAKLTSDPDSIVRQSAIASLANIKSPQVIPLIAKGLKDTDLDVVKIASHAITNFKFYRVNKIKKISPKMVKR